MGQELSCCSSDAAQNTFVPFVASALPDLAPFVLADKRLHAVVLGDFNPAEHQQVPRPTASHRESACRHTRD